MNGPGPAQPAKAEPVASRLKLAGVVGLIAPLAATIGLFRATGTIGRLQRDEPGWLLVAIALVLIAGACLTVGSYLKGKKADGGEYKKSVATLFFAGVLLTLVGFVIAFILVVNNASAESRPRITASLNQAGSKLTAEISASNLETSDRLAVKIDLATLKAGRTVDEPNPFSTRGTLRLERASVGPNDDGNVKQKVSVPIPRGGEYTDVVIKAFTTETSSDCWKRPAIRTDPGTACVFIALDPSRKSKASKKSKKKTKTE